MTDATHGPYHRLGAPGGPGCPVTELPVSATLPDGRVVAMALLSAGENATEVELLRTIAHSLGIQWGQDEFGWWAAVPRHPQGAD
jgi:hypothetical protein